MINRSEKEQNELREELIEIITKNPASKAQLAKDIGISPITLTKFLEKNEKVEFRSFLKIKNYIEKKK